MAEEASHLSSIAERQHALSVPPVVPRAASAGTASTLRSK